MMRSLVLGVTDQRITRKLITDTKAGRAVAHRFVAGTELGEAVAVGKSLNDAGLKVSLDYLGEHVTSADEADTATASYVDCIHQIGENGLDANVSIKLTQVGMGFDDDVAAKNLDRIAGEAVVVGTTVTVDMEESDHTESTISLYERAQTAHGNLGIAIQAYLHRSADDINRILPLGGHIRLCKGAYAEPSDLAHQSGSAVDEAFDRLTEMLMESSDVVPAIATHDDARIGCALTHSKVRSAPWEFQMLYGVRRNRQIELAAKGHDMRIYVPYGEAWYPYLTRRMAERPANLTFFLRALVGK